MVVYFQSPSNPSYKIYMGRDKYENEILLKTGFPEDLWFHVNNLSSAHVYVRIPIEKWREMLGRKFSQNMGIPGKGELMTLTEEDYRKFVNAGEGRVDDINGRGLSQVYQSSELMQATEEDYRSVLPSTLIEELCTLTKGNSIQGQKQAECDIVWTPFGNLRKDDQTMDTGTVGFINESSLNGNKQTWYIKNCPKNKELLKVLEKTRKDYNDGEIDLHKEIETRTEEEIRYRKGLVAARKSKEREDLKKQAIDKENKSYGNLHMRMQDVVETNDRGEGYKGTIEEVREIEDDFM